MLRDTRTAALVGLLFGIGEVLARAEARLGLTGAEAICWAAVSAALSVALAVLVSVAFRRWAPVGAPVGVLVLVQGSGWWRFEARPNDEITRPAVWGVLAGIAVASAVLALWVEWSSRHGRRIPDAWPVLGAVLAGIGFAWRLADHSARSERSARPDVLLVTLDTVRADRIGAYGSPNATPALDRLAREGVVFEVAVATAPLTQPSHLAMLGGGPPTTSRVVSNGSQIGGGPPLLHERLAAVGYRTAAFVSGFPLHARFGWSTGWDVYDDDFGTLPGLHRLSLVRLFDRRVLRERRGDRTVDRALRWLDRAGSPYFLWVHLFDAHAPYEAPDGPTEPPTDGDRLDLPSFWPAAHRAVTSTDWLARAYDAEVRFADAQVGRVIGALEAQGTLDRTLVVATADHGESLTEHGTLFDHGDDLYDPSLLVPLVVRYPPAATAGLRVPCQTSTASVAELVTSVLAAGAPIPTSSGAWEETLRHGTCRADPILATTVGARYVQRPPLMHAWRSPPSKIVRQADGTDVCFDLASDPAESRPMACPSELSSTLGIALGRFEPPALPEGPAMEALRALGYGQ